jgi:hypothetical protein
MFSKWRSVLVRDLKFIARWLGVVFSAVSMLFAISVYLGVWSEWRGDNLVAAVAARFDKSYSEDASRPVRPGDKEWSPLIRIIKKYSRANLPTDKEPRVFARAVAVASVKVEASGFEWTAPTTPIYLIYRDWPGGGAPIPPSDFRIVGTIEDLHTWIRNDTADFDYLVRTIIFGILSLCVGVFLALPDKPKPQNT